MRRGFDACVGNPPWVSYAGRAAQPLDDGLRAFYAAAYASFAGYKNLQGLFVERVASLLRAGGRLGLVVPSSMSEQDGYAPTRRAHDRRAVCDADLADLGTEAFAGVFQPCMALVSTRRAADVDADGSEPWPVERRDLDGAQRALLERLAALPPLPDHLFGERGLQTSRDDAAWMQAASDEAHTVALRVGADVEAFRRKAPSLYADPRHFGRRLRPTSDWGEVRLFIRQTARVPIAALADGVGFRNSILAGFDEPEHPAAFLVAWLNATPLRWLHFFRHRDARQGMPQVKIGHLRTIPRPPRRELVGSLAALGRALSDANCGADEAAQRDLDALAADALGLDGGERAIVARWREEAR